MCYAQTQNLDIGQNCYSLHNKDIAKYLHRGVSILFGHWLKQNTHNVLWVNGNTELPK